MRTHRTALAFLLASSLWCTVARAQEVVSPVAEADRAFADTLLHHDQAAFTAMLAPDATFTLPSLKRGREEIVSAWILFLVDPGTTLLLTRTEDSMAPDGQSGTTAGTFAIRGRTANGVQTIPAGTYSINWRMVDGRWQIGRLDGKGQPPRGAENQSGVGPYRFGMSHADVSRVGACQPYTNVPITGGLECPHYVFDGREMNISFLFTDDRLARVQLWYYEGPSAQDALDAVGRVVAFLRRTTGAVAIRGRSDVAATADAVMTILNGTPPQPGQIVRADLVSPSAPQSEVWFSRIGRSEYGYMVMLFAEPAR